MDNAETTELMPETKKKKKKDKVRSAWISFAGRIVAQMVGAIATVALGVMVLHRYTSPDTRPGLPNASHTNVAAALGAPVAGLGEAGGNPVHVIVVTPAMLGFGNADERVWPGHRSCTPAVDGAATSTAHLNHGTILSR